MDGMFKATNFQIEPSLLEEIIPIYDYTLNNLTKEGLVKHLKTPIAATAEISEHQAIIKSVMKHEHIINRYYYYRAEFHECYDFLMQKEWDPFLFTFNISTIIKPSAYQNKAIANINQLILFLHQLEANCFSLIHINYFPSNYQQKLISIKSFLERFNLQTSYNLIKKEKIKKQHYKELYTLIRGLSLNGLIVDFYKNLIAFEIYISIAKCTIKNNFCFPEIDSNTLSISGCYHPKIKNPITNDWKPKHNLSIITGPNMSGKSTFLKTIAICIWLAHVGVSIPAAAASIPLYKNFMAIFSNTDNLEAGYSYFMSEINHVKNAVEMIATNKKSFILFDELFKGTNYEDAKEISIATINGICKASKSDVLISTHLPKLFQQDNIADPKFGQYLFECSINNGNPIFNYKINTGWSDIKIGTLLFKNSGLETLLKNLSQII